MRLLRIYTWPSFQFLWYLYTSQFSWSIKPPVWKHLLAGNVFLLLITRSVSAICRFSGKKRMVSSFSRGQQLMPNVSVLWERLFLCLWRALFLIPNVAVNKVSIVFPPFPSAPVCSPKTPLVLSLCSLSNLLCQMMFSLAGTSNVAPIVSVLLRDSSWVDFSIAFLTTPAATLL